jgi:hypothetical protein
MAENDILLSGLSSVQALGTSLLYVAIVDAQTASGYLSGKITAEELSNLVVNSIQYAALNTDAKTIIGAINELETGGGGGGSSVSWSQLISTGTKIAEITINGVATDVYAPTSGGASYTDVTGTLTAGQTSITLSDASILTTSTIDIYTDAFGVNPTGVTVAAGSVTLTFDAQATNVAVKVRVS